MCLIIDVTRLSSTFVSFAFSQMILFVWINITSTVYNYCLNVKLIRICSKLVALRQAEQVLCLKQLNLPLEDVYSVCIYERGRD